MRRIDELHLEYPFAGSRMLKGLLQGLSDGFELVSTRAGSLSLMPRQAGATRRERRHGSS
jgi:hypothetical protein